MTSRSNRFIVLGLLCTVGLAAAWSPSATPPRRAVHDALRLHLTDYGRGDLDGKLQSGWDLVMTTSPECELARYCLIAQSERHQGILRANEAEQAINDLEPWLDALQGFPWECSSGSDRAGCRYSILSTTQRFAGSLWRNGRLKILGGNPSQRPPVHPDWDRLWLRITADRVR